MPCSETELETMSLEANLITCSVNYIICKEVRFDIFFNIEKFVSLVTDIFLILEGFNPIFTVYIQ